ncbi:MAG: SDR family oxidoreductase [bacterium]
MVALITGASSGIGKAIAHELAARKYDLIVTARRVDELNRLKSELESAYGIKVIVKPFDLSVRENCVELHRQCLALEPNIVINNAGFGRVGMFTELDLAGDLTMIDTNVVAVHILTKLFANSMKQGHILNVASMAGFLPTPRLAAYAATKSYVYQFSVAVNYELRVSGKPVHVATLCPGPVDTEFADVAGVKQAYKGISAERCAKIAVKGMFRNKAVIIPSGSMRFTRFLLRFIPNAFILPASYHIQSKK